MRAFLFLACVGMGFFYARALISADNNRLRGLSVDTNRKQLTLDFEGGLTRRYKNVLELVREGAYRHGSQKVAIAIDQAPSNLSMMLSGQRHFPLDRLEDYIDETGDLTPIYYLVEKYLRQPEGAGRQQLSRISEKLRALQSEIEQLQVSDS